MARLSSYPTPKARHLRSSPFLTESIIPLVEEMAGKTVRLELSGWLMDQP
jgi:hypothetical protein